MKLANVLSERAHLQTRLSELEQRLNNNAKVQVGEEPAEQPEDLLKEIDGIIQALEKIMTKINLVNSKTMVDGESLTELLARRDCLKKRLTIMRNFLHNASERITRYTKMEVVVRSTVSVPELQKKVDEYSKELRLIDERIQEVNWTTDVEM